MIDDAVSDERLAFKRGSDLEELTGYANYHYTRTDKPPSTQRVYFNR